MMRPMDFPRVRWAIRITKKISRTLQKYDSIVHNMATTMSKCSVFPAHVYHLNTTHLSIEPWLVVASVQSIGTPAVDWSGKKHLRTDPSHQVRRFLSLFLHLSNRVCLIVNNLFSVTSFVCARMASVMCRCLQPINTRERQLSGRSMAPAITR